MHLIDALDRLPAWPFRAAHDLGLATWFGGAYMGAIALNGASREVDDPTQRGRVATAGWFRWAAIVPVAIGLHVGGGVMMTRRAGEAAGVERGVLLLRSTLLGVALLATAQSGRSGRQVSAAGDVPVATSVRPIRDTPDEVAAAQRVLRTLQWVIPLTTATVLVVDAWQQEHGGTRILPPGVLRRLRLA